MKYIIATPKAPKASGPYSQAVKANGFVFVSGQLAVDPVLGELVGPSVVEQTIVILDSLKAILEAAGSSFSKVIKTTIYLQDMSEFAAVNEVYELVFSSAPPARATVEVSRLPKDARVEIELIAVV